MYMIRLLFSFSGRIKRSEWWLGTIALLGGMVAYSVFVDPGLLMGERTRPMLTAFFDLMLVYPTAALIVKRFADLSWPMGVGYLLIAGNAAIIIPDFTQFAQHPTVETVTIAVGSMVLLAEVVICGCIKAGQFSRTDAVQLS